jgi:hypothetical protein
MGKRYHLKRTPGYYVQRDRLGRFKKFTSLPKGIAVDKRKKVEQKTKESGHGHTQDYKK